MSLEASAPSALPTKASPGSRVLTYTNTPDYKPDIDSLSPLRCAVLETVSNISTCPSTILRDLSEHDILPSIAGFDAPDPSAPPTSCLPPRRPCLPCRFARACRPPRSSRSASRGQLCYEPDDNYASTPITLIRFARVWEHRAGDCSLARALLILVLRPALSHILGHVTRPGGVAETRRGAVLVGAARGGRRGRDLRSNRPFRRAREEELLYVLHPGSALSDSPSKYAPLPTTCNTCAAVDRSLPPSALIADSAKRSTRGHLFHF
ncbi:hypothetical protein FA95DRAFT_1605244 [Auriscalpium vulgare]|uniref:Uncharacterized protein n=1 Tax=Auriscalpium vulgare TaxID=40419 RepID=A0ACB8RX75_9AGAM|nr:hypothetical protein FA95DRAFT_1605244 [Auriscalpium vulgare]